MWSSKIDLVHATDELVDVLSTLTGVAVLDEVAGLLVGPASERVGELEGPEEVVGLLEVGADGDDLVDEILDGDDAELAQVLLNEGIVGEWDALAVDLAVATLVDELADRLEVGLAVGNVGLDQGQHLRGGLGELDKDAVVDLNEAQELHDLPRLRRDLVDTLDSDHKRQLGLGRDVKVALHLGEATQADLLSLGLSVLLDVLLGALEDGLAVGLALLYRVLVFQSRGSVGDAARPRESHDAASDPKDGIIVCVVVCMG